jgi:hypothetical protein
MYDRHGRTMFLLSTEVHNKRLKIPKGYSETVYRRRTDNTMAKRKNKMNCELMLTYDTPALRQTGSRKLMGPKTLPTIWYTYMTLVTKYQISAINSC